MSLPLFFLLICLVCTSAFLSLGATPLQHKQSPEVVEGYQVCRTFERLLSKNLDFAEAYEATFARDKSRRRAIAIADGEFGRSGFALVDDDSLIKAYKLRMQLFYLTLILSGPSEAEAPVFFPPEIRKVLERKAPLDMRRFVAYVAQLEGAVDRFRSHLDRLAASNPAVAERISKFKSELLAARLELPTDHIVEPRLGEVSDGQLVKGEAQYTISNYLVAEEDGKMRIVGIRFFNRLF